jgi:hypothetical protein
MDKVNEKLGEDNGRLFSKGPMEAMNILTFAGTLTTSKPPGLGTVAHNHQTIEKNDNPPPKVIYKTHTDQGSPDPKLWVMNFRAFDDRAGGLITSFNKEREEL